MKDGGPAFPVLDSWVNEDGSWRLDCRDSGMALRDYYRGQVMNGMLSSGLVLSQCSAEELVQKAEAIVNLMLAEREKET
jgi:hypothetical protein